MATLGNGFDAVPPRKPSEIATPESKVERRSIDIHVGGKLRAKRVQRGLRQDHLANVVHMPLEMIEAYEQGERRIIPSHLSQFSSLLGVAISSFYS